MDLNFAIRKSIDFYRANETKFNFFRSFGREFTAANFRRVLRASFDQFKED